MCFLKTPKYHFCVFKVVQSTTRNGHILLIPGGHYPEVGIEIYTQERNKLRKHLTPLNTILSDR